MATDGCLDEVHVRILRVTEDLRAIQRELNCAAMEATGNPEVMDALTQLPEMESLQVLKSALDQMRHFLWFYMQVMTNQSEAGEQLRNSIRQKTAGGSTAANDASRLDRLRCAADTAVLQYLTDGKDRKPN